MQNAWSALRGAVQEFNAVLLSEDEEEEEEEDEQLLGDEETPGKEAERSPSDGMVSSNRATVRELGLRLQQQEQQRLFAERRLQQVESVAAKHAQEVINLRSECRLLRASARGVSTGSSAASDAQADADPFSELSIPSTSAPRSDVLSPGELRGTLNRVLAALSIPEGVNHPFWHNGHFGFSGAYCAGRTPSVGPTWEKQANQDLDIFAALDREESPVKEQSDDEASKPKEVSAEAQGVLAQLDGLCCFLEYISGRAEWLLKEWRDLKASPTFREVLISRLGPRLPPNQVAWLSTEVDNQDVHTAGASSPLLEWLAVSAQLMECLNSLSADASSDTATALDTACVGTPTATVSRDINRKRSGGGVSRQSSVRDDSAPVNGGDDASLCPQGSDDDETTGSVNSQSLGTDKRWREEVRRRQLMQHQISFQERRIHELDEELRSVKEAYADQVEKTAQAVRQAEEQEVERQAHLQQQESESLRSIRQQYEALLQQYEKLQATSKMDSKNRETDDCTDAARIQHLESENQDLLLLIKSWQQAHGSVSESLQAVSAELSEARSNVLKIEALEQEVASTKKELHRFSDLQKVQNQSEMELIRSHAEREAIEQELSESRQTVASLNKVIERMQAEGDAAAKRLRAELDAAAGESIQLRRKVEENARAQNDLSEARRKVAESVEQISALEALLRKAEEENKELKSGIGRLMDRQQKEEEERENYVDRRIISQMIAKHQQLEGQWRRRDEVFLLICDVLQLSEQDRENIGIRSRRETGGDQGSDKRLSEKFIEFLKKETE